MKKRIKVQGMVCEGCENRIKNALKTLDNVENVVADHTTGIIELSLSKKIPEKEIKKKIEDIGFEVIEEDEYEKSDFIH